MVSDDIKYEALSWADALQTGVEPSIPDLARIVFGLYFDRDRLEKLVYGQGGKGGNLWEKNDFFPSLST